LIILITRIPRSLMSKKKQFNNFKEFYKYYLSQHRNPINRILHFAANIIIFICFILVFFIGKIWLFAVISVFGYCLALFGHLFFEKNKPVIFKYPFYGIGGDIVLFYDMISGRINKKGEEQFVEFRE